MGVRYVQSIRHFSISPLKHTNLRSIWNEGSETIKAYIIISIEVPSPLKGFSHSSKLGFTDQHIAFVNYALQGFEN
jgi:hypothetical protein